MTNKILVQIRKLPSLLGLVYLILLGLMVFVGIIALNDENILIGVFTEDPAAFCKTPPFAGAISNIGMIFWCSTSAICFFSAKIYGKRRNKIVLDFLIASGLLTFWLLLDDLFLLHESIFPLYFQSTEPFAFCVYIVLVLMYLLKFKTLIAQKTEYLILFIACGFFGLSIIFDIIFTQLRIAAFVEDGSKLFGIVTWFIYYVRTCFFQINSQKINQGL